MPDPPDDFATTLARVLDARDHESAAEILEAATMLDDEGLRRFLDLFARRVRASAAPVTARELRDLLQRSAGGAPGGGPSAERRPSP